MQGGRRAPHQQNHASLFAKHFRTATSLAALVVIVRNTFLDVVPVPAAGGRVRSKSVDFSVPAEAVVIPWPKLCEGMTGHIVTKPMGGIVGAVGRESEVQKDHDVDHGLSMNAKGSSFELSKTVTQRPDAVLQVSADLLVDIEKCPEEWKLEDAQVFCSRYCCPKTLVPDGPGTYRATFDSKEAAVRACIAMSGAQVTTSTGEQVAIAAQHVGFEKRAPELQKAAEEQKTSEEQKAAADQQIAVGHKAGRWTGKSFKDALVRGPTSDPKQKAAAQAKPDVKHKAAAKKAAVPAAATKANQEGGAQSTAAPKAKVAIAAQHVGFEKRAPELQKAAEEQKASEEQKAAADQQIAVGHKAPYDAEDKSWAVVRKKANRKCTRPTPVRDQQMLWPKVSIQMEDGKVRTADYQLESRREEEQGCPESPAKAHNDVDKADHDGDWVVVRNNRKKAQHKTKTNKATSAG